MSDAYENWMARRRAPIYRLRWWISKKIGALAWKVCPEPDRTMMKLWLDLGKQGRDELEREVRAGNAIAGDAA